MKKPKKQHIKTILYILILSSMVCCNHTRTESQTPPQKLSIAPRIDQKDSLNQKIIATLEKFQATKDSSLVKNEYWDESDFKTHIYPYTEKPD